MITGERGATLVPLFLLLLSLLSLSFSPAVAAPPSWVAAVWGDKSEKFPAYPIHDEKWFEELDSHHRELMLKKVALREAEKARVDGLHKKIYAELGAKRKGLDERESMKLEESDPLVRNEVMMRRLDRGRVLASISRRSSKRYSDPFVQALSAAWVSLRGAYSQLKLVGNSVKCKKSLLMAANNKGQDTITYCRIAYQSKNRIKAAKYLQQSTSLVQQCAQALVKKKKTGTHMYADVASANILLSKAQKLLRPAQVRRIVNTGGGLGGAGVLRGKYNCDLSVDPSGANGAYKTVQSAVDAASNGGKTICIYPGTYNEQVTVPASAQKLHFQGTGGSQDSVKITSSYHMYITGNSPLYAATLIIKAPYFRADSITVENSFFSVTEPAPAISVLAGYASFYNCAFLAWMDTVAAISGNQYYSNVYVSGKTDTFWGSSRAVLDMSEFYDRFVLGYQGYILAPGSDDISVQIDGQQGGFVLNNCKMGGNGAAFLGRPYRDMALAVLNSCYLDSNILPEHWQDWEGHYSSGQVYFKEYNCNGPGAQNPSQRQLCMDIGSGDLQQYQTNAFIKGNEWL